MLESCDTFVVLPPLTENDWIIFGKNSDRPFNEVQEIVFVPAANHEPNASLKCTYIKIDQIAHTSSVVLSKPAWMWGAEMGANEHGVVAGNEAVWTKCGDEGANGLIGMDLLRLGLERAETAENFVETVGSLLEKYGQGGCCSEDDPTLMYNNTFLVADYKEAWLLETAGREWAAEKIDAGYRNISNVLTIRSKIDKMSSNLKSFAKSKSWWNGQEPFDFATVYGTSLTNDRLKNGKKLLEEHSKSNAFTVDNMMKILRDKKSGLCMERGASSSVTASSQVSILAPSNSNTRAVHFFTGTPDPSLSAFKPFIFSAGCTSLSAHVKSPVAQEKKSDQRHALYKLNEASMSDQHPKGKCKKKILSDLNQLEQSCVDDILGALKQNQAVFDAETLFNDAVDAELKIYKY